MAHSLKQFGSHALAFGLSLFIERIIPAIAVGLVAAAHELHHDNAQSEAKRRA